MNDPIPTLRTVLEAYRLRADQDDPDQDDTITRLIEESREEAVGRSDQSAATRAWCMGTTFESQNRYIAAFRKLKKKEYYEAWCDLERAEITTASLKRHLAPVDAKAFGITIIESQVPRFQSLFPYKSFISPCYLIKERRCSICNSVTRLRSGCKHQRGEIYDGKQCHSIITKADVIEISLVPDPVQKYSVVFIKDPTTGKQIDHYDYTAIAYVTAGLSSPFDRWHAEWTRMRHPHSQYPGLADSEPCPCDSGREYKNCCLSETGVLRPHLEVHFERKPPGDLPRFVLPPPRRTSTETGLSTGETL